MANGPGIAENLERLQTLLIARAVNRHASDNTYQAIRDQLLSEPSVKGLLPRFVSESPNLGKFWRFISKQFSTYQERREFLIASFAPLLTRYGRFLRTDSASKIFIGHGRSQLWRALKDFIADRLGLEWEEFNREPAAGISTKERLQSMLESSCFAFLIMTAEEERPGGTAHARDNVVHEAGLFHGRLGFERAIILLEDGCSEFSNIHGLTHIPFPKDHIEASFEAVRRVLEREGIV